MTYLFGLAADPLTKGHIDIIKNVIKRIDAEDHLDILVSNTDEKIYRAPAIDRMQMTMRIIIKNKGKRKWKRKKRFC